jgi:hypothetical protein
MTVKQALSRGRFRTWLRHVNRDIFNRLTLTFAGRHVYAVMHHVGRRTGHLYTTPVVALPIADGFMMPLLFGADTDWCRNLLAGLIRNGVGTMPGTPADQLSDQGLADMIAFVRALP